MSDLDEPEQDEELEWEHDELDELLELYDDDGEEELEEDSKRYIFLQREYLG